MTFLNVYICIFNDELKHMLCCNVKFIGKLTCQKIQKNRQINSESVISMRLNTDLIG